MGQRKQQKAATRAKVLAAAREIFHTYGYDSTTLQQVATHAGVAVGTVVAHFPDKPQLAMATWQEELDAAVAEGLAAMARENTPIDALAATAAPLYHLYALHPLLYRRVLQETLFLAHEGGRSPQLVGFLEGIGRELGRISPRLAGQPLYPMAFFADYYLVLLAGLSGQLGPDPIVWCAQLRALLGTRNWHPTAIS